MSHFSRLNNAVKSAKKYIDYLVKYHLKPKEVQLIIIFFNTEAKEVHNKSLDIKV